jgi:excisionase family DNA binding protein
VAETKRHELTTREAAELAGVTDSYIRRLLIGGTLKGRKLNNWIWLVSQSEVERWIAQRREK